MKYCPHCGQQCTFENTQCKGCGELLPKAPVPESSEEKASSRLSIQQVIKETIGDYTLLQPLKISGFGDTSLIEKDGQQFILKHLSLDADNGAPTHQEMFLRECQIFSNLSHPGLPKVVGHAVQDAHYLLLLDCLVGTNLWERLSFDSQENSLRQVGKASTPTLEHIFQWITELAEVIIYGASNTTRLTYTTY